MTFVRFSIDPYPRMALDRNTSKSDRVAVNERIEYQRNEEESRRMDRSIVGPFGRSFPFFSRLFSFAVRNDAIGIVVQQRNIAKYRSVAFPLFGTKTCLPCYVKKKKKKEIEEKEKYKDLP